MVTVQKHGTPDKVMNGLLFPVLVENCQISSQDEAIHFHQICTSPEEDSTKIDNDLEKRNYNGEKKKESPSLSSPYQFNHPTV